LLEGTLHQYFCATNCGQQVSGALVSRPWSWSGAVSSALHSIWRSHAQAPSGDVQPGTGSSLDSERSYWFAAQLPLMLRTHRARSGSVSPRSLLACDASLQELRSAGEVHRRSSLRNFHHGALRASFFVRGARSSAQGYARCFFPYASTGSASGERLIRQPLTSGKRNLLCHALMAR
jgi:hypothetical protein